jgi:hypothetical protein
MNLKAKNIGGFGLGGFGYETMGPKWIGEINGSHLFGVLFMMGFPESKSHS